MLVGGYARVGKTTLIQELYKPLVRQRGYFILHCSPFVAEQLKG
jgi:predicted ATPase